MKSSLLTPVTAPRSRTTDAIRSRAKASIMSMSPFGRGVEQKGLESLRKIQLSNAKSRAVATPIGSQDDEDLFLCARLGQMLLKKNQDLNSEMETLRARMAEKDEQIRELKAMEITRKNLHHKLAQNHRLLQTENLDQHSKLMEQERTITELRHLLERERSLAQQRRAAEISRSNPNTPSLDKENVSNNTPKPAKSITSDILKRRHAQSQSDSPIIALAVSTPDPPVLPRPGQSRSTLGAFADAQDAKTHKQQAFVKRSVRCATSQTVAVQTKSTGVQTDDLVTDEPEAACVSSNSVVLSADAPQLPESQQELELLLKVILQSLFNKKLERQLESESSMCCSLGEEGIMDPATAVGVDPSTFFDFNFLEQADREGHGIDPELRNWYADVFAPELDNLQATRHVRRLSMGSAADEEDYQDEDAKAVELTDKASPTNGCDESLQSILSAPEAKPAQTSATPESQLLHAANASPSDKSSNDGLISDLCYSSSAHSSPASTGESMQANAGRPGNHEEPMASPAFPATTQTQTHSEASPSSVATPRTSTCAVMEDGVLTIDPIVVSVHRPSRTIVDRRSILAERGFTVLVTFVLTALFSSIWRRRYYAVSRLWKVLRSIARLMGK